MRRIKQVYQQRFKLFILRNPDSPQPTNMTQPTEPSIEEDPEDLSAHSNSSILEEMAGIVVIDGEAKQMNQVGPVPYVFGISPLGVMTIAFDRRMKPVEDPLQIARTKVAIDYDFFQQEISQGRRRTLNRRSLW